MALPFISVLIIGKIELNIKDNFSKQYKTLIEMIYTDERVFTEVLYKYMYTVAL